MVVPDRSGSRRGRRWGAVLAWLTLDSLIWVTAALVATKIRWDFDHNFAFSPTTLRFAAVAGGGHLVVASIAGAYRPRHVRGSFDEVRLLALSTAVLTLGLTGWTLLTRPLIVPRSVPVISAMAAYVLMLAARFVVRSVREARSISNQGKIPIIVFGAGNAGRLLVHSLVNDPDSHYVPVAMLDDDRSRRRMIISGVRVRGSRADLEKVSERTHAQHVVIAMPSVPGSTIAELRTAVERAGLKALVVPPLSRVVGRTVTGRDIRDIDLEDLLGRKAVQLDQAAISECLNRKVVLVTGAGGSIGSELCRQIARFHPAELVLLDRDESALHSVSLDLVGHGLLDRRNLALADIRDLNALRQIFEEHRPEVVFHTAALKHLPLLESYPLEAWKSNVLGTYNVLTAAAESGVSTFVNISTDKAAEPTSMLGCSKRIGERLTADFAHHYPGRYLSVRFGNVLGSRGSVIPAFQAQIRRGGPVTVTHPDVERYFMLIPEACQLVMEAAAIGNDGEVMVLEMGEPVKIVDVAKTLISLSGRNDIEIEFTGLRPGEKLSETLFDTADNTRASAHPLLRVVDVPPLDATVVRGQQFTDTTARTWMHSVASDRPAPAATRVLELVHPSMSETADPELRSNAT